MPGPAHAGLFVYAKDLDRLAAFYETLLGMTRLHASGELVVLQSQDVQLVVHRIPSADAARIAISTPPVPREDSALKFFFTVASLAAATSQAAQLGGGLAGTLYEGRGFRACNAWDPEGNIFQMRERAD